MAEPISVQQLKDASLDAKSLEEVVNGDENVVVTTRLGETYPSIKSLLENTMSKFGYIVVDSFEVGATLTQRNQALRHAEDGNLYRWAGELPKTVAANSTPESSGGFGDNAWLEVSDTALRQEILIGGLLTDTLVTMTKKSPDAIDRTLLDVNNDTLNARDFGFVGGTEIDNTDILNTAFLASRTLGRTIHVPDGVHRVDGTVTMQSGGSVIFGEKCTLSRLKEYSDSTEPVFILRGSRSCSSGGRFSSQNASPNGVISLGHKDANDTSTAVWWRCLMPTVSGVNAEGNIGIHVPSGQINVGASTANYFGYLENPNVSNCGEGIVFAEVANAHTVIAPQFYQCRTSAISFYGAYGNVVLGGFMHGSPNGTTGLLIKDARQSPAPHNSDHNRIVGFGIEPGGISSKAFRIDEGSHSNTLELLGNTAGGVSDASRRGANKFSTGFTKSYDNTAHNRISMPEPAVRTGDIVLRLLNEKTYFLRLPASTEGASILLGQISVEASSAGMYDVHLTGELPVIPRFDPVRYSFAYSRAGFASVAAQVEKKTNFTRTAVTLVVEPVEGSPSRLDVYLRIVQNGTGTPARNLSARLTHTPNSISSTSGVFIVNPELLIVE